MLSIKCSRRVAKPNSAATALGRRPLFTGPKSNIATLLVRSNFAIGRLALLSAGVAHSLPVLTSDVVCARLLLRSRRASAMVGSVLLEGSSVSLYMWLCRAGCALDLCG